MFCQGKNKEKQHILCYNTFPKKFDEDNRLTLVLEGDPLIKFGFYVKYFVKEKIKKAQHILCYNTFQKKINEDNRLNAGP